ncbi:Mg2+ transporter protein, CorA-like/Zinc transport protein ZntB [Penicillium expansum]|uniref:Mg2+ transporter protein, CorA-like/Zinc transport protein ZntB n=1 Tax=Penicillium expansum TaxID=27334 RepID=A0A0A2KFT5_PENEN|nr:Mg2+ transporter protein, CorA-like/Zinc transport protein ZntB [Penicillium expansum]KGO63200.1 Mg2+ transporter protein, CorA-like/Zinc transport protein ZntB [Penicillium expansum]
MLRERQTPSGPTCANQADRAYVDQIVARVYKNYQLLHTEARKLDIHCAGSSSITMNSISIHDAKESINQAERVRVLTFLAYLFLPFSFIAAVFGMNVLEFTTPNPPIWLFFCYLMPYHHDLCFDSYLV